MSDKNKEEEQTQTNQFDDAPIFISDLYAERLFSHQPEGLKFTQNSVPFDFDGDHLVYMEYKDNGVRTIYMDSFTENQIFELQRFSKSESIISHVRLARDSQNSLMLLYV